MFIVYVLFSEHLAKYYIGHTGDLSKRLRFHNTGKVRSTKTGLPWKTVYTESYVSKQEAYRRELQIKRYKSGNAFKKLINS